MAKKKLEILYLAVSADIYLLPMAVFDSLEELAEWAQCSKQLLRYQIKHHIKSISNGCFFEQIRCENDKK